MRLRQLDILRALAVLLVLGSHAPAGSEGFPEPVRSFFQYWQKTGWIGVDLFFVLSGFLVSGLLFREYKNRGTIDAKRFLIRRGFKIYPAFYMLFLLTLIVRWLTDEKTGIGAVLAEGLFLQNYHIALWGHTWSLAVEEHFYILLGIGIAFLVATRPEAPFRPLVFLFALVPIVVLGLRIIHSALVPFQHILHHWPTHLRIDALLFGTMLSYVNSFHPEFFAKLLHRRWWILLVSLACLWPPLVMNASEPFMHTIGYTLLSIGFGGVLIFSLGQPKANTWGMGLLLSLLVVVGTHSYSIYLWHVPFHGWGMPLLQSWFGWGQDFLLNFLVYLVGSCLLGVIMAKIIEFPFLHLRDRLFPARSNPPKAKSTLVVPLIDKDSRTLAPA
jgi:peptidoglycan/LPS O-acetylase OafA/YrhL